MRKVIMIATITDTIGFTKYMEEKIEKRLSELGEEWEVFSAQTEVIRDALDFCVITTLIVEKMGSPAE